MEGFAGFDSVEAKKQFLQESCCDILFFIDGFDEALIGVSTIWRNHEQVNVAVYDYLKAIDILIKRHELDDEEAAEYMTDKIIGNYHGMNTPIFIKIL